MPYANPEERRAYNREYRKKWIAANPGYWKKWPKRSKERSKQLQRRWRERNPEREIFIQTKCRAKRNGVPFSISFEDVAWVTHCPVFGESLIYDKTYTANERERRWQATLDRHDNTRGYIPGNVYVISHKANRLKSDMTRHEIWALLRYVDEGVTAPVTPP